MKKLLVILLALAVILTACAQKPAEITALAETPVEIPVAETPTAPETPAETPAVETPAAPVVEEPETPIAPAETPKSDELTVEVAIGDSITYKDTTFKIDNIANSGNELYLNFNAFILKLKGLNQPEILNNVEYKIASNANYAKGTTVTLNIKPLKLEKDQYLIMRDKSITVNNTLLTVGEVKQDTRGQESAYFYINEHEYWVKLNDNIVAEKLSVTLDKAFYQQRYYAILTIVPK